jgi:osmotically-inducible protein OsmY
MAGRWSDEERNWRRDERYGSDRRDRDWRAESDWRGRGDEEERRAAREPRSFQRGPVFGENDYGAEYNKPAYETWQRRDYGGASPAMRDRDHEPSADDRWRGRPQDYTRGGRYYGDDAETPIYREEYGLGGREYGEVPRGWDEGRRFGTRDADRRWEREMHRPVSGGTGGYDYERGYGDGGRGESRRREPYERWAHDTGAFFRQAGERVSGWFGGDERHDGHERRSARGLGPSGYKRSDDRIAEQVHDRLTDDPWVDATHVNVSVSGGEVTLSGTVEDREAKHRCERLIEDLPGVRHVQNNLRVDAGSYFTRAGHGYGDSAEAERKRGHEVTRPGDDPAATRSSTRRT